MEDDTDDTTFARDALATPSEVAGIEAESAELAVAATGADEVDALGADTGVGRLAAFLEGSVISLSELLVMRRESGFGFMHTSSCDSMRAWHQRRCACDGSHGRYYGMISMLLQMMSFREDCRLYPMIAVGEGHC